MNTLAYVSHKFDVLFSASTPPSTPLSSPPTFLRRRGSESASLGRIRSPENSISSCPHPAAGPSRPRRSNSSPSGFRLPPSAPQPPPDDPAIPPKARLRLKSAWTRIHFVRVLVFLWNTLSAPWISWFPPESDVKAKDLIVDESIHDKSLSDDQILGESTSLHPPIPQALPLDTLGDVHAKAEVAPHPTPSPPQTAALNPPGRTSRSPTPTVAHKTPFHLPKTLVLDLDETLIHSTSKPLSSSSGPFRLLGFGRRSRGHTVEVVLAGRSTLYHVHKRPFVDYFLRKVSIVVAFPLSVVCKCSQVSGWYTLVVFTASMQEYADPVIDWLDAGRGILTRRFFREVCFMFSTPVAP